jgi:arylsulfatase A-like enzyme
MRLKFVLSLVPLCILATILSARAAPSQTRHPAAHLKRYAVVIVLDATRPDDLTLVPMPHLQALIKTGTTYDQAFVGQELANTPPSHATIGTGMLPKHHGIEDFVWENPQTHQVEYPTAAGAVESGQLEQVLSQHRVPSVATQLKAADPSARVESAAAHKCYASDAMGGPSADYILCSLIYHNRWVAAAVGKHRPPPGAINNYAWDVPIPPRTSGFGPAVEQWRVGSENTWTVKYALWGFRRTHYPRVLMINLAESDVLGHYTTSKNILGSIMSEFDGLLGQIEDAYRQAGLLSRTDFVITADHGMSAIHSVIPYSTLLDAVAGAHTTSVYIEHDTAATIGLADDRLARAVAVNVYRLAGRKVDATLYKTLRHGRWAYRVAAVRPLLSRALKHAYITLANTMAADSGPDVFVVYAPHTSSRTNTTNGYTWVQGHLGPQWDDQHIPLILAGPGIKAGEQSSYPARLVDIAPTIEHLLGAKAGVTDGVILDDALDDPSASGEARQRARAAHLDPIVRALEHRSGYR